ncbi:MAG: class I SAM-dependent methyltransferase [Candidatus Sungiibacteriota bacterium]
MMQEITLMTRNEYCRGCKGTVFECILSLGVQPPANAFLRQEDSKKSELAFPLDVYFCRDCALVQLRDIVSPELLFKNYVYVSSTSPTFVSHFRLFAEAVVRRFRLGSQSFVIDIGSNDGILLRPFQAIGIRVLGVDPAEQIAAAASAAGIETLPHFFTPDMARDIGARRGQAAIITATNVFAHINDLDAIGEGVKILLETEGVFIIEAPYLVDFLEQNLFDTVYHEHLSYFSVSSLNILLERLGMKIIDVEKTESHGGSLRVFAAHKNANHAVSDGVNRFLHDERAAGLHTLAVYEDFAQRVEQNKIQLTALLKQIKAEGKTIAGYGAPAKGNTLLNYFGIGAETLDYIADDSEWKQGLYTPGTHIPVVSGKKLEEKKPDYILILAWNFADPIMKKLEWFSSTGGKFIIPVPTPRVL